VNASGGLAAGDAELARRALQVLDANWLGHATRPSPRLYPHQWSWDSACVAMGYASWDQARAEGELRSLFAGQWSNGLLPHIVFTDGARYFPGPEFWQTERSSDAPGLPRTSGIVQPPIHATAAWTVYRRADDRRRAAAFLEELMPRLVAWHDYLYRERTRADDGLVEIWHPWESGMDNSPLWDDALARISLAPEHVPAYERVDVELSEASERPTDDDYDRYAYLVGVFRDLLYRPDQIRDACPFVVQPVLFNALLVQSNRDLAEIAGVLGTDPQPFEARAEQTAAGLDSKLWDDEHAMYVDHDVRAGEPIRTRCATGFAPLYAGVPADERARRMVERLLASGVQVGADGWAVTSLSPDDPRFEPTLYWRGPVWPIINWVLYRGLRRYGFAAAAERLRRALIELATRGGFWEHYSPTTGRGHGGEQFAWTAALVLDLLRERPRQKGEFMATRGRQQSPQPQTVHGSPSDTKRRS
jgi:mannosylglycerate hydrolase